MDINMIYICDLTGQATRQPITNILDTLHEPPATDPRDNETDEEFLDRLRSICSDRVFRTTL